MKKLLCLLIAHCLLPVAYCQSPYWQQQVDYKIEVTLNDVENSLDGFIRMDYYNNSPDTLHFIWIHLWPNAYKNDRTAFSDQTLENGSTAFYFSDNDKRGYINSLDFKVNDVTAKLEDHPQHQDIVKLILPTPIAPKTNARLETPFHVKLPYEFSRGGHKGQSYQITQWYPKPAVYDRKGWHPIPYLDQGEFYSEFGNYEVQVKVPKNYVVAATGELQNEPEKKWMSERTDAKWGEEFRRLHSRRKRVDRFNTGKTIVTQVTKDTIERYNPPSAQGYKTLQFRQDKVHDFAWFADKRFNVETDTVKLPSGRVINCYSYFLPFHWEDWQNSIAKIKRAILTKSKWVGEYPYNIVSVVDGGNNGGMEYPTITLLESGGSPQSLDFVINHEVGHNWFYGILASNERTHPWMDEGMNTYYDARYAEQQYGNASSETIHIKPAFLQKKLPTDVPHMLLQTVIDVKKDQPIETRSEKFNILNYNIVAYTKTGDWMKRLEKELGKPLFDSCMREYYRRWQFRHPYPEDFKKVVEDVSGKKIDADFALMQRKGNLDNNVKKKDIRITGLFNLRETDKHNYISLAPALGFNFYDRKMLGAVIHNYSLPLPKIQFIAVPLYASTSKQFNGIGRLAYSRYPGNNGQKLEVSVSGESFTSDTYQDSVNTVHFLRFYKVAPSIKYVFANKDPRSTVTKFIQWKTFLIGERGLSFERDTVQQIDIITYPTQSRYINQLRFVFENNRVLYPYKAVLKIDQGEGFARADITANYFFNYAKGGGLDLRFFAGKFFYLGDKTLFKQFQTDAYHLNMTGPKGYEDYTYSNYFVGRSEYQRWTSQQIMIRDGAFKVRTDLLSSKVGKTDNWLAAMNLTTTIPKQINPLSILPFKIPIKAFLDIGTYAEAWKKNAETGRFIYDAGLQLSLFKNVVNVYFPLLYSKVYSDYFKSTIQDLPFVKNIVFSIDLQNINLRRYIPQIPF